jgi:hypothetical protein
MSKINTELMVSSLKLTSALLFFVGAHLLVPRIADAAAKLNQPTCAAKSSTCVAFNKQTSRKVQVVQNTEGEFEPPNYGGPDSEHGSGTR